MKFDDIVYDNQSKSMKNNGFCRQAFQLIISNRPYVKLHAQLLPELYPTQSFYLY